MIVRRRLPSNRDVSMTTSRASSMRAIVSVSKLISVHGLQPQHIALAESRLVVFARSIQVGAHRHAAMPRLADVPQTEDVPGLVGDCGLEHGHGTAAARLGESPRLARRDLHVRLLDTGATYPLARNGKDAQAELAKAHDVMAIRSITARAARCRSQVLVSGTYLVGPAAVVVGVRDVAEGLPQLVGDRRLVQACGRARCLE